MRFPLLAAGVLSLALTPSAVADLDAIRSSGKLRVIVWADNLAELYAPQAAANPGLEAELLQGFASLHGLTLEVVTVASLDERLPALLEGRGDLVAGGLVDTTARRRQVDFSAEVFPIRHLAVNRRPAPRIDSVEALRRLKVGTIPGSSWAEEVATAGVPAAQVDGGFDSAAALVAGLRSGRVEAAVFSVVWALVEARRDPDLQTGAFVGAPTSVGFAVRRDEPKLKAALDAYVGNVRRTPTWSRLVVKYFGESGLEILKRSRE